MLNPSPIEPERKRRVVRLSAWRKAWFILGVFVGVVFLLVNTEPQGAQSCEIVEVLGTVKCARGSQCFVVQNMHTGKKLKVRTFVDKPFAVDYIGPAALLVRRGQWTGAYHFEFRGVCPSPSRAIVETK